LAVVSQLSQNKSQIKKNDMKKGIFTLVTFLSYVSARAADIATTDYFLSGDMSQEADERPFSVKKT